MRLSRLDIQSLPGIQPSFTMSDIAAGINMVTGPNAVGKSSVIRALDYLISDPRNNDPPALSLGAEFETDQGNLTVRRTGREIVWERDGRRTTRPALPDRDQFYCYWLSMEDLLEADQRDRRLVAELRRALRGGYDLEALRREPSFDLRSRTGQREGRRLRDAEKALREVETDYDALRREESKIPSLDAYISAARVAAARVQPLEQALLLMDVRRERRQIEAGLAELPANMAKLHGDEEKRLEAIERRRDQLRLEFEVQVHARDAAQGRLDETGLAKERPEKSELEARVHDLDQASYKNDLRQQEHERLVKATTAEQQALEGLGGRVGFIPQLDPHSVSEAETLARELQEKERYQGELADRLQDLGDPPDRTEIDSHFQAVNALREWLAADGNVKRSLRGPIIVAVSGSLFAIAAAFLAQAWLALVGAGIALTGLLWMLVKLRTGSDSSARQRFAESGLEPPTAWQREPVEARLQEIDIRRTELQQQLARASDARDISVALKRIEEELQALRERKAALADKLSFDPMLTAAALDRFVRLVQQYEQASKERKAIEIVLDQLEADIHSLTERVISFIERWSTLPSDPNLSVLNDGLVALRNRLDQAENAERNVSEAVRDQRQLESNLQEVEGREAELFRDAGLKPGQRAELMHCLAQLTNWNDQQARLQTARVREAERHDSLKGEGLLLQRVEADDRDGLMDDLAHTKEEAAGLEGLQNERTTIQTRLSSAGHDQGLELALAELDTARSALEDRYEETLLADTAQLLLDQVEERYQSEHEPDVLRDARERFRRFTHYAFELELDEKEGFVARDLQQQARRTLSELSSATRMQLLIAMRLAWAGHSDP